LLTPLPRLTLAVNSGFSSGRDVPWCWSKGPWFYILLALYDWLAAAPIYPAGNLVWLKERLAALLNPARPWAGFWKKKGNRFAQFELSGDDSFNRRRGLCQSNLAIFRYDPRSRVLQPADLSGTQRAAGRSLTPGNQSELHALGMAHAAFLVFRRCSWPYFAFYRWLVCRYDCRMLAPPQWKFPSGFFAHCR